MIGAVTSVLVLGVLAIPSIASIASAQNATGGKYDWRKYDNRRINGRDNWQTYRQW
jgi:hypothetical protein